MASLFITVIIWSLACWEFNGFVWELHSLHRDRLVTGWSYGYCKDGGMMNVCLLLSTVHYTYLINIPVLYHEWSILCLNV